MRTLTSFNDLLCIDHQRTTYIFNKADLVDEVGKEYVDTSVLTQDEWNSVQSKVRDFIAANNQDISNMSPNDIINIVEQYISSDEQSNGSSGGGTSSHTSVLSPPMQITEQMIKDVFANLK